MSEQLSVERTTIPGLLVLRLPVHGDSRGWFKESWQRAKMTALGLPDFAPVQNNVAWNAQRGVTRGIHAEPWDKLVSVASGRIYGAWVDLREGEQFGSVVTVEMGPDTAVFVPRGVGNSYQTLEDSTSYTYLVNEHWSQAARSSYTFVNLADPDLAIAWPIPLAQAELSEADRSHPPLAQVPAFRPQATLVLGASGQLGRALQAELPQARFLTRDDFDLADPDAAARIDWAEVGAVVNAAAYTAVDEAETAAGRRQAWAVNALGVSRLVEAIRRHRTTLVHFSSDYVFDGTCEPHAEDEPLSPLGVYGQTKAAGDLAVMSLPRHYLVRTSWVVGHGANFVRTMASLADRGVSPDVVDDQHGRLTFVEDLARATDFLLGTSAPFGTYNLSCGGAPASWADIARTVFAARGRDPGDVQGVSTAQYAEGRTMAPRPARSTLDLHKLTRRGFAVTDMEVALAAYLADGLE